MMSWKQIRESEPVRVWMYPLLLVAIGIAVQQGVIDTTTQGLVQGLLAAVLGIGGIEAARGRVAPVRAAQHVLVNPEPGYDLPSHGKHEAPDYDDEWKASGADDDTNAFPVVEHD